MGVYLAKPVTEKISEDGKNNQYSYGSCSMQGWRKHQEDAHYCNLSFTKDISLFAVYDGHGGPEVAIYCKERLPHFIRMNLHKDIPMALKAAFMVLDQNLKEPEVIRQMKIIAQSWDMNKLPSEECDKKLIANMPKYCRRGILEKLQSLSTQIVGKDGELDSSSDSEEASTEEKKEKGLSSEYCGTKKICDALLAFNNENCSGDSESSVASCSYDEEEIKQSPQSNENVNSGDEDDSSDDNDDDNVTSQIEPGSTSGCTAVVAVIKDDILYVANAGDSRCVISRHGTAIEMSIDHKPEDHKERMRIENAGGKVTDDGRVNEGLNLSRALGDHCYKANKNLGPEQQMISCVPDIKVTPIDPLTDEFVVLACDGIWNSLGSQEVVTFIRSRLYENTHKLSSICEQLFEHCMSPNTEGDGTGCDNMTCIIVTLQNLRNSTKRCLSDNDDSACKKKSKINAS